MGLASIGLAFLAGLLTILSPCVLPLLPIVLGAAASEHRLGPVALAGGVALAYVAAGMLLATLGATIGLFSDDVRYAAAILMIGVGVVLAAPALQTRLAIAGGPISRWADDRITARSATRSGRGVRGQFGVGLLLGAVWAPCVGPTLGAASLLASRGNSFPLMFLTMTAFAIGATLPLIGIGLLSRQALARWRGRMLAWSRSSRRALGIVLALVGALIVSGLDKRLETILNEASPTWLTELTTRF